MEAIKRVREQEKRVEENMKRIKYKIAVLSGKGGVGKSFITSNLAFALAEAGWSVGVFDADIYGPSIPRMMGVDGASLYATPDGRIIPAEAPLGVKVVSIGLMLPSQDTPVIWRGALTTSAIRELLAYTDWGELDYLLVDLPPGTGDEQLTIMQLIKDLSGTIIVTIPSQVSAIVVEKAISFSRKLNARILGIVENMSYFECPDGSKHFIFGEGVAQRLSSKHGIPFLGSIPIEPAIARANDAGEPFFIKYPNTNAAQAFRRVASNLIEIVTKHQTN
jgi:ATP-binding protein involved in chromosome partitioning